MPEAVMPKVDGSWLVYRESYKSNMRQGAASKAITEYLEAIGYEQIQVHPTMMFKRGSGLASLYHPNPKRQYSEISIDFASIGDQSIIELVLRVNRFGNMPLSKDYAFWRVELDTLEHLLQQEAADVRISDYAADAAMWYSVSVMLGVFMAVMVVLMAISYVLVLWF